MKKIGYIHKDLIPGDGNDYGQICKFRPATTFIPVYIGDKPPMELTKRQKLMLQFALHRFVADSVGLANAAAQDLDGSLYKKGDFEAFMRDYEDGKELMALLKEQFKDKESHPA